MINIRRLLVRLLLPKYLHEILVEGLRLYEDSLRQRRIRNLFTAYLDEEIEDVCSLMDWLKR